MQFFKQTCKSESFSHSFPTNVHAILHTHTKSHLLNLFWFCKCTLKEWLKKATNSNNKTINTHTFTLILPTNFANCYCDKKPLKLTIFEKGIKNYYFSYFVWVKSCVVLRRYERFGECVCVCVRVLILYGGFCLEPTKMHLLSSLLSFSHSSNAWVCTYLSVRPYVRVHSVCLRNNLKKIFFTYLICVKNLCKLLHILMHESIF